MVYKMVNITNYEYIPTLSGALNNIRSCKLIIIAILYIVELTRNMYNNSTKRWDGKELYRSKVSVSHWN